MKDQRMKYAKAGENLKVFLFIIFNRLELRELRRKT